MLHACYAAFAIAARFLHPLVFPVNPVLPLVELSSFVPEMSCLANEEATVVWCAQTLVTVRLSVSP